MRVEGDAGALARDNGYVDRADDRRRGWAGPLRRLTTVPAGETGPAQLGHDVQPGGGQVKQLVEPREVRAQVADDRRGQLRLGKLGQHHSLASAVDPASCGWIP
ncbi:MAG: hypothetical protein ACRDPD_04840 [Streptosporangiaceae bacterium]